jgi:hypothetical protein
MNMKMIDYRHMRDDGHTRNVLNTAHDQILRSGGICATTGPDSINLAPQLGRATDSAAK